MLLSWRLWLFSNRISFEMEIKHLCVLIHIWTNGETDLSPQVKYFTECSKAVLIVDHLCYLCLVFVMLSRVSIAALWSPAGKGLTSWLSFVMFYCVFVTFPCGILGQVWYLIVSIPDLCYFSYFLLIRRTLLSLIGIISNTKFSDSTYVLNTNTF